MANQAIRGIHVDKTRRSFLSRIYRVKTYVYYNRMFSGTIAIKVINKR